MIRSLESSCLLLFRRLSQTEVIDSIFLPQVPSPKSARLQLVCTRVPQGVGSGPNADAYLCFSLPAGPRSDLSSTGKLEDFYGAGGAKRLAIMDGSILPLHYEITALHACGVQLQTYRLAEVKIRCQWICSAAVHTSVVLGRNTLVQVDTIHPTALVVCPKRSTPQSRPVSLQCPLSAHHYTVLVGRLRRTLHALVHTDLVHLLSSAPPPSLSPFLTAYIRSHAAINNLAFPRVSATSQ
ncbi:uncharacterized protein BO80DRAFT_71462 [Aspergillus ibericus CBS 121593]|uniref:Uncharacterized protein n=1 Tax=Aspergillus ibericus CBS 121593 TaxID=1448316 RepID=A0A395H4M3_9EURO|nr:hypothetical protein BO80DRAFT_71462 [Aspergillus ibericus CBS 121593]RAL01164.1 hypothetical protein BO80DRAFT_71462 [Aspergillus ibericus CBS 121593]